jgi:hypothetical protein
MPPSMVELSFTLFTEIPLYSISYLIWVCAAQLAEEATLYQEYDKV